MNKEPAFPVAETEDNYFQGGMTLRDYFAAKAMSAYLSSPDDVFTNGSIRNCAEVSYEVADAMINARNTHTESMDQILSAISQQSQDDKEEKRLDDLALFWVALLPRLEIAGMTHSIAANCVLVSLEDNHWVFHIEQRCSQLLTTGQIERIGNAIAKYMSEKITIRIAVFKHERKSPADYAAISRT